MAGEERQEGQGLFEQVWQLWIEPEVAQRQASGTLPQPFELYAAQVLMEVDQPHRVRLNKEVQVVITVQARRAIQKGERITEGDFGDIKEFKLTDADPNAGHVTMLLHEGAWWIGYDFRYNAARVAEHLQAAREFLDSAKDDLEHTRLRPFCEALFAAGELLAKAKLLQLPNPMVMKTKKHGPVAAAFNRWSQAWPDLDRKFRDVFNQLDDLRASARYLKRELALTAGEGTNMLVVVEDAYTQISSTAPRRYSTEPNQEPPA